MATEQTYKRFSRFISNCVNTTLSLLKVLIRSKFGLRLPQSSESTCFVLANGPSLKTSLEKYPAKLKSHPLIAVNTFAMTAEYSVLKPAYYVMVDPFFWEQENETTRQTFRALQDQTTWKMFLLVPRTARHFEIWKNLAQENKNIQITYFNYTVYKGFSSPGHWLFKKNLAMPQSLNVSIAACFIAINLGFKEIMLIGADHTWHENLHMSDDNILHTKVTHFYENDVEVIYKPFHKAADSRNPTYKAHEFFDIWSRTFYAYEEIARYAERQKVSVYNASEESFIDAFPRKKIAAE